MELAPFKKGIKLDDPPQHVDKSHLCDSTITTTTLNETCPLNTSCDHLLHLDPPSISSELQENSIDGSTEPESVPDYEGLLQLDSSSVSSQDTSSIETEFLAEFEGQLDHTTFHQQMFSLDTMTMNCSSYKKRLMHHMTILIIRTLISIESKIKMSPTLMPPS